MAAFAGGTAVPDPTWFDWLTGIWVPVVVGVASISLALAALVVAAAARKTADTALAVTRDAAERDARMPRERVAHAAIMSLNAAMNSPWQSGEDFELRVIPTINELVQSAGAEGVDPNTVQLLVRWLIREAGELAAVTTSEPRGFHEQPSRQMGILALRLSFGRRVDEWVKTEQIDEGAKVLEEQSGILKPIPVQ